MPSKTDSRYFRSITPEFSKIHIDKELAYIVPTTLQLIIGITGPRGSGKDIVAEYLVEEEECKYYSLSHIVRTELRKKAWELSPVNQQNIANKLRKKYCEEGKAIKYGYLAEKLNEQIRNDNIRSREINIVVVNGIEHPDEIRILRKMKNFFLIGVSAGAKTRFDRLKKEGSLSPDLTWQQFCTEDAMQLGKNPAPYAPNISRCLIVVKELKAKGKGYFLDNNRIKEKNGQERDKEISEIRSEIGKVIKRVKRAI